MIQSFKNDLAHRLFIGASVTEFPPDLKKRARRKLEMIHYAHDLRDLISPPGNRLKALKGNRKGQHAIRINDQWRICFRFQNGNAYDVEVTDYH
ncbi:MAG: type II toxin-antitoxin system RelE/ParE family toxin [Candidatus Aminicenantes bacterium]|nr:type II toxin-antitoxin system RelE/ParE family toxin [Candidatus Aminicenantes bacterium]